MNFEKFVKCLSYEEIESLRAHLYEEHRRRLSGRVEQGDFGLPTDEEKALWHGGRKVDAIRAFKQRTGRGLVESKTVLEILA